MENNQYRDLPQIYGVEEPGCNVWSVEQDYHIPLYKEPAMTFGQSSDYSDESDNGMVSLRPMQRFIYDQRPFHAHMLYAKTPLPSPYNRQYIQQWPVVDMTRKASPDCTSTSGLSSHASQCEVRSPPAYYTDMYSSPIEYSQHLYTSTEPFYSGAYHLGHVTSHNVVNPRELEIEHHVLKSEAISEGVEDIEDIETVAFEQESGYNHESAVTKPETSSASMHYADSGIGYSVRDAESVQPTEFPEEPASDSDYKPTSRPPRRKKSSASAGSSNRVTKRRVQKRNNSVISSSSSSTKRSRRASNASKSATKVPLAIEDRRSFPCPLAPYGCDSNFVSKNEWKRHVSTQHIKIGFWRCDICAPTTDPKDADSLYHNDFNRMDLFRQHLRRMHAAPIKDKLARSSLHATFPVTEDNLTDHQTRCYHELRTAPQQSSCLFCPKNFSGPTSWAERMDHVGSHLEKGSRDGADMRDFSQWRTDLGLEQYLLEEGLIKNEGGEWSIGDGRPRRYGCVGSEDEESEEE
ncbi:hypothetical protein NX059_004103 [Plenodomus lindquistii]|nr:hypothetical protein NX059_004103 [Plenodomus lindquistii]